MRYRSQYRKELKKWENPAFQNPDPAVAVTIIDQLLESIGIDIFIIKPDGKIKIRWLHVIYYLGKLIAKIVVLKSAWDASHPKQ